MQVNITKLIDEVQCYQTVRELRWPDGVGCPSCESKEVINPSMWPQLSSPFESFFFVFFCLYRFAHSTYYTI